MAAKMVDCPNCQSKANAKCTQPTESGRKAVRWVHSAREQAAAEKGFL